MQYCALMTPRLSTTGYAVLGMLALRPATPYELTQQMQRSLDYCWPTSERSLYDQPERLVAAGLATVEGDDEGRRRYAVTEEGRAALSAWLAAGSAMPRLANEPLLRTLFADQGEVEDLHRVLADLREHVDARRRLGLTQMAPYLDGEGLFQERAHVVVIVADLVARLLDTLDDWAAEVQDVTADWHTTRERGLEPAVRAMLERMVDDARRRVGETEGRRRR